LDKTGDGKRGRRRRRRRRRKVGGETEEDKRAKKDSNTMNGQKERGGTRWICRRGRKAR